MTNDFSTRAGVAESHKRDFWIEENRKHTPAHYRLRKTARIVNAIAGSADRDLLDVGCGPATLGAVLRPNIRYFGIDIAIQAPAPNLLEADILKSPVRFGDRRFDIVVAQGVFEYLGAAQSQKFEEIAGLLTDGGKFVLTYTNFGHRARPAFEAFSNVRPMAEFRRDLARHFLLDRSFPTAYTWNGGQPTRKLVMSLNSLISGNIPIAGPRLAAEYFFVCSRRP